MQKEEKEEFLLQVFIAALCWVPEIEQWSRKKTQFPLSRSFRGRGCTDRKGCVKVKEQKWGKRDERRDGSKAKAEIHAARVEEAGGGWERTVREGGPGGGGHGEARDQLLAPIQGHLPTAHIFLPSDS